MAPLATASPQPNGSNASLSTSGYLVEYCEPAQRESVLSAIEIARIGASMAYDHAISPAPLYGYSAFFKTQNAQAVTMLKNMANYEPLGLLLPRFACVTPQSAMIYPDIKPSPWTLCQTNPTIASLFIRGHNNIFICPFAFKLPTEPFSPAWGNCPKVFNNVFDSNAAVPKFISNVIVANLVHFRLQQFPYRLPSPVLLNEMVALTAQESYLSPPNYEAYIYMVKNQCEEFPDINLPPWIKGSNLELNMTMSENSSLLSVTINGTTVDDVYATS